MLVSKGSCVLIDGLQHSFAFMLGWILLLVKVKRSFLLFHMILTPLYFKLPDAVATH